MVFLFYISPVRGLLHHCVIVAYMFVLICLLMLYLWLLQHVCVLHTLFFLVVLHIGNIFMSIFCILIVMLFLPSLLAYIHNSTLTYPCLNYLSNILKHIYIFPIFSISYVFISIINFFSGFVLLECWRFKVKICPKHLEYTTL